MTMLTVETFGELMNRLAAAPRIAWVKGGGTNRYWTVIYSGGKFYNAAAVIAEAMGVGANLSSDGDQVILLLGNTPQGATSFITTSLAPLVVTADVID